MAKSNVGSDRGVFLTIMLALAGLGLVFGVWGLITGSSQAIYSQLGVSWMNTYAWVAQIAVAAYIYGIWNWQKWGVYLLAATILVGLLIQMMYSGSISTDLPGGNYALAGGYLGSLIAAGLWYWSISRKWKYFK